jgi:hypothetical protein
MNPKQEIKKRIVPFFTPIGDTTTEESGVSVMVRACILEISILAAILTKTVHVFLQVIRFIVYTVYLNGAMTIIFIITHSIHHHYHRHLSIPLMTGLCNLCTLRSSSYNLTMKYSVD